MEALVILSPIMQRNKLRKESLRHSEPNEESHLTRKNLIEILRGYSQDDKKRVFLRMTKNS